jgi:hypothetical protein
MKQKSTTFMGWLFNQDILEYRNIKAYNYGMTTKEYGKHLEEISVKNLIKVLLNNLTEEQLSHYKFVPLNEKGEEFPCCEYWYYENGVEIDIKE